MESFGYVGTTDVKCDGKHPSKVVTTYRETNEKKAQKAQDAAGEHNKQLLVQYQQNTDKTPQNNQTNANSYSSQNKPTSQGNPNGGGQQSQGDGYDGKKMKPASDYDYSKPEIDGKMADDLKYVLHGDDGNMFSRYLNTLKRDWEKTSTDDKVDLICAAIPFAIGPEEALENTANLAKSWLGEDARVIVNKAGDKIFISKDGLRKIRFDINNSHRDIPHIHLQELKNGKWKDVIPNAHRLYPKP